MSRRFQKLHRSSVRRSSKRRKRQQELASEGTPRKDKPLWLVQLWDSEEGLFAGDAFLPASEVDLCAFA